MIVRLCQFVSALDDLSCLLDQLLYLALVISLPIECCGIALCGRRAALIANVDGKGELNYRSHRSYQ